MSISFFWLERGGRWGSPVKEIKCSFLDYIQLLMIGQAGRWTRTPSTTLSSQKNKTVIFGLCSTSDDQPGWLMDSNPICHLSPAKKKNVHFWITFNFWWSAGLVNGLEPHLPPFSDFIDQPGWSSEVQHNPKMNILFFWLERGGIWGSSPLTFLANHQKLNVIHKRAFHFFGWREVVRWGLSPLTSQANNQKLNVIQKWAFHFFWLERGGRWGFSPLTSPANHQKLNVIQKWAF